jgi:purine-binding chemotaxis protein CheW
VVNIASSDIDPPPSVGNDEGSRYIQGIYSTEQQILILIDLNKLINEENRDAIGMF